jgi:hypothetical protein
MRKGKNIECRISNVECRSESRILYLRAAYSVQRVFKN